MNIKLNERFLRSLVSYVDLYQLKHPSANSHIIIFQIPISNEGFEEIVETFKSEQCNVQVEEFDRAGNIKGIIVTWDVPLESLEIHFEYNGTEKTVLRKV